MSKETNRFIQISTTIGAIAVNGVRIPEKDTAEEEVYMSETGQLIRVKKAQIVFVTEDTAPRRDPGVAPKSEHPSGTKPDLVIVDAVDIPDEAPFNATEKLERAEHPYSLETTEQFLKDTAID